MLQRVALLLLAVAVHQAPATEQLVPVRFVENIDSSYGSGSGSGSRIVSGWDAQPGQHPHQAHLRMINANGQVQTCGGSIIHSEWVITAARCSARQITIYVRAGGVQISRPDVSTEATAVFFYPTYDVSRPVVQLNDVSLLQLQQPLQFTQNIRPIRLQPSSDAYRNYANEIVYASGFGRTWTGGAQPEILQWVYLRGVSNLDCARTYGTSFVNENTICARFFNVTSQSICQGDIGGPLVHVSRVSGEPILIGISSFVPNVPHGCHSGVPGAFIRPGPFHYWFEQITGIDFDNLNDIGDDTTTEEPTTSTTMPPTTLPPSTLPPTTLPPTTTESTTVTLPSTTTPTTPDSEEDDDDEDDDGDEELSELLKRLEVKVKVKVKMSKYGQKKNVKKEKHIE